MITRLHYMIGTRVSVRAPSFNEAFCNEVINGAKGDVNPFLGAPTFIPRANHVATIVIAPPNSFTPN